MNKKGSFEAIDMIPLVFGGVLVFAILFLVAAIYDDIYVKPLAAEKANQMCKFEGFDQHKTFTRVGLFSENPVGIKCEYAERYTDLGVRTN